MFYSMQYSNLSATFSSSWIFLFSFLSFFCHMKNIFPEFSWVDRISLAVALLFLPPVVPNKQWNIWNLMHKQSHPSLILSLCSLRDFYCMADGGENGCSWGSRTKLTETWIYVILLTFFPSLNRSLSCDMKKNCIAYVCQKSLVKINVQWENLFREICDTCTVLYALVVAHNISAS